MLVVEDLLAMGDLGLTVRAGAGRVDRPVTWAHVSELLDPTTWLEGDELLLTTGLGLPSDPRAQEAYVARLVDAGTAALGFGVGVCHETVPTALLTAAERRGLPVLEVHRRVPFIAITKAVSRAVNAEQHAAREFVFDAQHRLTRAVSGPDGPAALLAELASLTGGWALLVGRAGTAVASSPAGAAEHLDRLGPDLERLHHTPGPSSIVAHDESGATWLQSLVTPHEPLGVLAVGRPDDFTPAERQVINTAVPLLTLALGDPRVSGRARARLSAGVMRLLIEGRHELAVAVAGHVGVRLPDPPVAVLALEGSSDEVDGVLRPLSSPTDERGLPPMVAQVDEQLWCVLPDRPEALGPALEGLASGAGVRAGMSRTDTYARLGATCDEALLALRHAQTHAVPLATHGELPRPGLLDLVSTVDAADFRTRILGPVLQDPGAPELIRTLSVWLSQHGHWGPAAETLGIHRHTLRSRIDKIERLLGVPLGSAGSRAELWMALSLGADPTHDDVAPRD